MLTIESLNKELDAKREEGLTLLSSTMKTAEDESRAMSEAELEALDKIAKQGQDIQGKIARLKGSDAMRDRLQAMTGEQRVVRATDMRTMGQQFVESDEYRGFFPKQLHRTSASWRSPSIELYDHIHGGLHATTLTTDPASGGKLISPQVLPGIQPLLFRPNVVADLLASGTTDSNAIQYMVEKTFTNNAAAVLEGAAKPESAMTFDATADLVRKLAHWLPVTEEMLEDVPQIRSYIDARLRLGVQIEEDDQLLNGDGIAPNLLGLMNRVGLTPAYARVDPMTNAEALFIQTMIIYGTSFIMPTGYVVNPINWASVVLMKTSTGEYLAGGPFSPLPAQTLWGISVAVTPAIVANTALVGAFKTAAQVFRKGGIRVEASNSHQDYFIKNLVAIRAEERLALAVYRPQAIGKVTGLTGQAGVPGVMERGGAPNQLGGSANRGELPEGEGEREGANKTSERARR
jgi:HK97 family phage major capsid protein